ncbi:phage holin, LLH family [Limosilactobacillus avium]|uniref:phage holin, LLH family n=1 Tax=Limosilactobacillus avium TaxID=2991831 RepID=UPI0024BA38D5|nr:phage holin, LLH family [Limosilactobacillus avium]
MMKTINDIVNWLISSGALSALFIFAWKYLKPVMIEKQKHAKTVQERELIELLNQLADNAVNSLVSNNEATGHDKFKQATSLVGGALADKGFDVKRETVEQAVQSAYEKSDLTPTVDPNAKPQTGVVVHNG